MNPWRVAFHRIGLGAWPFHRHIHSPHLPGRGGAPVGFASGSPEKPVAAVVEPRDLFTLLKPRVMSLVIFTAWIGVLMAPGPTDGFVALTIVLAIAAGAGASGAYNMAFDADIDARMTRTRNRPLPRGRVSVSDALSFATILSILSVGLLTLASNWSAGGLLAFTIFFYAIVYTQWLKRRTPQNIVIGGFAGALPPLIGYVAATGEMALPPVLAVALIFFWTPAHFWALALFREEDYRTAAIPMLPVVAGHAATFRAITCYGILTVLSATAYGWVTDAHLAYHVIVAVAGFGLMGFIAKLGLSLTSSGMKRSAQRCFQYSNFYLFLVFAAIAIDETFGSLREASMNWLP